MEEYLQAINTKQTQMDPKLQIYIKKLETAYQELLKVNALEKYDKMNQATEEYHAATATLYSNFKLKQANIQLEYEQRMQQVTLEFEKMFRKIEEKIESTSTDDSSLLLPKIIQCHSYEGQEQSS